MSLNRRTLLLGLVVLVVGAGVIGASGAFSQVQAERTLDIQTSGDGSALLALIPTSETQLATTSTGGTGNTGGVQTLELSQTNINENAETVFENEFQIRNNGEEDVTVYINENGSSVASDGAVDFTIDQCVSGTTNCNVGDSIVQTDSTGAVELGANGGRINVSVRINTRGDLTQSDLPSSGTVTFVANETS